VKPSLLLVGLGNPGAQYADTRHNLGYQALDALSAAYGEGEWKEVSRFDAATQEARIVTVPVLLVKPLLYMNRSGEVIRKIVDFYKMDAKEQVLVLVDDLDIPAGELRLRKSGGPGTHNGMRSIVEQFGEDFPRLRIGIGPKGMGDLGAWILSATSPAEREALAPAFSKIPEMVKGFVLNGTKDME
jgi:PTH1 family peptidyl-tRNA hydrolase